MSNGQGTLARRWKESPRAIRWALIAGAGIAFYFGVIEQVIDAKNRMNTRSDSLQRDLSDMARTRQSTADSAGLVEQGTAVLGKPMLPELETDRISKLDSRVVKVFEAHKVATWRRVPRESRVVSQDVPASLAGRGMQLAKIERDLTFETDMVTLTAVLRDFELAPEVTAVSKVVLKRASSNSRRSSEPGPLSATITVESWVTMPLPAGTGSSRVTSATGGGR